MLLLISKITWTNSENLIDNYGSKSNVITNIENYLEKNENLINQIMEINNNSNILEIIVKNWEICSNKITNYINKFIINDIKGEDIGRWPLFIMLSSAIGCFAFSTSFHWFSIYSKELYSFLCRLDYAVFLDHVIHHIIIFTIAKNVSYKLLILKYSHRNSLFNYYNNFFFHSIRLYFISRISWS